MFQFFNIGIGVCVRLKVSYYTGIGKFFPYPFYFRIKLLLSPDICISRLTGGYKPSGNINSNSE